MRLMRTVVIALLLGLLLLGSVFAGGSQEPTEGKQCRIWFWGEDEAVGITGWMEDNARLFAEKQPGVSWEVTHLDIDAIYTGLQAAMEAKDAPELHTVWSGLNTLQYAWTEEIVPVSDYVSKEVISHIYPGARAGAYWDGKLWNAALYLDPWYAVYNKNIWRDSGMDPENFPTEWSQFIAGLQKTKSAGYIPWSAGMKDGYYADFFSSCMQYEYYNDVRELQEGMLGVTSLAQAPHDGWWHNVQELRDKGLLNEDAMSLSLAEGIDLFTTGKVAYTHVVQPQVTMAMNALGKDAVMVTICPVPSKAKLKGYLPIPTNPLIMPAVSKYKEEAGKFIEFYLSPARQKALYEQTGVFPSTDQIGREILTNDPDRKTFDLVKSKSTFTFQEYIPPSVWDSMLAICQALVAGNIDAAEAAQQFEDAAAKWRKENPQDVENYKKWLPDTR